MTAQDRDVLVASLIGGTGMLLALTGLGWIVVNILNLIKNGV